MLFPLAVGDNGDFADVVTAAVDEVVFCFVYVGQFEGSVQYRFQITVTNPPD